LISTITYHGSLPFKLDKGRKEKITKKEEITRRRRKCQNF
jgi:hypothetical protein